MVDASCVAVDHFAAVASAFVRGGVRVVQLRMKGLDDRARLRAQREVMTALGAQGTRVWLVINDRADLAHVLAHEAPAVVSPGLHLGRDDLSVSEARAVVGSEMLIGSSTHDANQAAAAQLEDVDYIGFGPVFPTRTKKNPDPVVGLGALARVVSESEKPVVAIGGVEEGLLVETGATGVRWVAAVGAVYRGLDLATRAGMTTLEGRVAAWNRRLVGENR